MEKRKRKSDLPKSLIPHLFTGPFPPMLQPSASPGPEDQPDQPTGLPPIRTFALSPVPSLPRLPPINVRNDPLHATHDRSARPVNQNPNLHPTSGITRSMVSLSLPAFPSNQGYPSPMSSEPQYHDHTSRTERFLHDERHHSYSMSPDPYPRGSWQEQEAGPSSLAPPSYESATRSRGRGRRGSSQPVQTMRQTESFNSPPDDGSDGEHDGFYFEKGPEDYPGMMGHPTQPLYSSLSRSYQRPPTIRTPNVGSDMMSSQSQSQSQSQMTGYRSSSATSLGPSSSHLGWAPRTGSGFGLDHPTGYSPTSLSDGSSDGRLEDEGDEAYTTQTGKKRRPDSITGDDSTKKGKNTRKTAVACNFCRGRKLRCNGAKPACSNCMARKFQCEYVPVQRRRGPGKAPKGTKSKKGSTSTGRSEHPTSLLPGDRASGMMPEMLRGSMATGAFMGGSTSGHRSSRGSRTPSIEEE